MIDFRDWARRLLLEAKAQPFTVDDIESAAAAERHLRQLAKDPVAVEQLAHRIQVETTRLLMEVAGNIERRMRDE